MGEQQQATTRDSNHDRPHTAPSHPWPVEAAHRRAIVGSHTRSRYIDMSPGERIHVIERDGGEPVVLIHGSGPSALLFLPLLSRLDGVRAIAVDRPGFGLSDPPGPEPMSHPDPAVVWLDRFIDALGLDEPVLLGSSTGGTWALWYSLARPDRVRRLILLGAPPLLAGTQVPEPMLVVSTPQPATPQAEMPSPSPQTVVQSMRVMGEGDTIVEYPELVDGLVAAAQDPLASGTSVAELRSMISPTGWREELTVPLDDLRKITVPTLLIWGEHDPLGGAEVAQAVAASIPHARLEMLTAGHAPWLGHPDRTAELVTDFIA